ncbi:hypothetical protein ANCDUO_10125 [Ancylostoma duodenale]|uniref:Uncharacterized protein n=1 Tax=Ancylostoma duodenale TaxID=51022 RepID=A0A0C2GL28_9BILA|nr:hypothetical protein ANCDUO_10125 [Ancylostoma duodenale]
MSLFVFSHPCAVRTYIYFGIMSSESRQSLRFSRCHWSTTTSTAFSQREMI